MLKFSVKILLLMTTLLFGLMLGIQQAGHGIDSIEGTNKKENNNYQVQKINNQDVEVVVLGQSNQGFTKQDLEEKQEQWQERYSHNRLSSLGNSLGSAVYYIFQKGAEWIALQIDRIL